LAAGTSLHRRHSRGVFLAGAARTLALLLLLAALALLTAYLEDRPFYLFDEWAADQDPHFRRIFYEELLPDLKARGKIVICVTHDDRWFHLADRVYQMNEGRIEAAPSV